MATISARWRTGEVVGRGPAPDYEVECGFCHQLVELPASALGRGFPCPACGGMLALVSPVPIIPAVPELPVFEPLDRDRWHPPGVPAERRAEQLDPAWRAVRRGLVVARWAALGAIPLLAAFVLIDLFAFPFERCAPLPLDRVELLAAVVVLLVPLAAHAVGMAHSAKAVPFPGAHAAQRGLRLQAVAVLVAAGLSATDAAPLAFAILLVAGFGLWLAFLNRLARYLDEDDHAIIADVRARSVWYWAALAVAVGLYGGAHLAIVVGNWPVLWLCRAALGGVGLLFLFDYATLLRVVAWAVARRAPLAPTS